MKVWMGYGSEHSANLVIIGKFKDVAEATEALNLLNEATEIARDDERAGHISAGDFTKKFSEAQMDLFKRTNLSLGYGGPEQLLYDFSAKISGDSVIITTEEDEINSFLKILLHHSAKVEVYSAHEHDGAHGR